MSKLNMMGYISLIVGVAFLAIALTAFSNYQESIMVEPYFCMASMCLSRADIYFPVFFLGYLLLASGMAILGEHIISYIRQIVFGR